MKIKMLSCYFFILFLFIQKSFSQEVDDPYCIATHDVGKLALKTSSVIAFGGRTSNVRDCLTNKTLFKYGAEYPKNSGIVSLRSALIYIGGIIDNDTLMIDGEEWNDIYRNKYRSTIDPTSDAFEGAVSEQDYMFRTNLKTQLNLQVSNSSFAWSYDYADDFVLFDVEIKNLEDKTFKDVYIGLRIYFITAYNPDENPNKYDDIGGFLKEYQLNNNCELNNNDINMIWGADNDGDPVDNEFVSRPMTIGSGTVKSATSVSGAFFLDFPKNKKNSKDISSYNWWSFDYNPQHKSQARAFKGQYPSFPEERIDYYYIMSNHEVDFDQIYTASISEFDPVWTYPDQDWDEDIADGYFLIPHMLSIGPFDIPPGGVLKIPFAYVAGENFHTIPTNIDNLPNFPNQYYRNLDFTDLVTNAQWARWIYDNPGVDTDGDGDSGLYQICVLDSQLVDGEWTASATDTFWYRGDGIPDWKAAGPPPAPYVWLDATHNGVHVRFNGSRSETEKDIFTRIADFEGYNIYFGRDERETSLSLVASYDKDNYDKFVYDFGVKRYTVQDIPLTLEQILCTYADSCNDTSFDPLMYTRSEPLFKLDSLIFFEKHAFNVEESSITKVYPNARDPRHVHIDSLLDSDYTDDGYFKFFEYEYFIENLLPTVSYWVNVTAFDFGSPKSGLKALETSKVLGIQEAYPLLHADDNSGERKQVYIYPNPYKINGDYRKLGYEGRTEEDRPDYRVRELNFANLPPKCEIKIFSLDGDLIRHLSHNMPDSDPTNSHHQWDLITRNTQMIVSGLYYWTVEFPDGEVQMGKFVAIM